MWKLIFFNPRCNTSVHKYTTSYHEAAFYHSQSPRTSWSFISVSLGAMQGKISVNLFAYGFTMWPNCELVAVWWGSCPTASDSYVCLRCCLYCNSTTGSWQNSRSCIIRMISNSNCPHWFAFLLRIKKNTDLLRRSEAIISMFRCRMFRF